MLIGRDGRVKVVDFGIARAIAEAQMTLPGTTLGSVHYFSPEQARGETATDASDIYALGIVLYEMLTGTRPWEGDSAAAVALARLSGPVPDPCWSGRRCRPTCAPSPQGAGAAAHRPLRLGDGHGRRHRVVADRRRRRRAAAVGAAAVGAGVAASRRWPARTRR